jgi:hypothetical protein
MRFGRLGVNRQKLQGRTFGRLFGGLSYRGRRRRFWRGLHHGGLTVSSRLHALQLFPGFIVASVYRHQPA